MSVQNTLGLDDDLDGLELVEALRAAFGVTFPNKDAEKCSTVGDLYRVLLNGFNRDETGGQGCASAMAFYRIRRACFDIGISGKISPEAPLFGILNVPPKKFFGDIESRSGLILPRLLDGSAGVIGVAVFGLSFLAFLGILWAEHSISLYAVFAGLSGLLLRRFDRKRLPKNLKTMGDLSKAVASLNFGKLVLAGAKPREKDVWEALTEVLAMNSILPKAEIRQETVLLESQLKRV
jgi:acyl carrier protein